MNMIPRTGVVALVEGDVGYSFAASSSVVRWALGNEGQLR